MGAATYDIGAMVAGAVAAVVTAYVAAVIVATETAMSRRRRQRRQCVKAADEWICIDQTSKAC